MTSLIPTLAVVDGIPRASSLDIADHFGKQHKDVMRAINNAITQVPEDFAQRNFAPISYQDEYGREQPAFTLTHDGFSFVVMGFTGKEAAKWKVVYITAFRAMAESLNKKPTPKPRKRLPALPLRALPRIEQAALPPAPEPLPDHSDNYRRLREDLDLLAGILRGLIPSMQVYGPQTVPFSQLEIGARVKRSIHNCLAAACEAQSHLAEANRFARMIKW